MQRFADDDRQFDIYSSLARDSGVARPWSQEQTVGVLEWPLGMFPTVFYCQI
jgi:hypothetical protein